MRKSGIAAAFLLVLASGPVQAGVTVNFVNVEEYDGGHLRGAARREAVVRELDRHLRRLAARYLPEGRSLRIDVLDLDLAGTGEPFRTGLSEPRILTDATPPRFKLRYRLTEGRRVLAGGTETVRDPNYLWNPSARLSPSGFVYERETLTRWFRDRLVKLKPPRG